MRVPFLPQITFDYPFRIPPYFALIIRAISVLEGELQCQHLRHGEREGAQLSGWGEGARGWGEGFPQLWPPKLAVQFSGCASRGT